MKTINQIAEILSTQIDIAAKGQANVEQADVVIKSTDMLIKLARLQIEVGQMDWAAMGDVPVLPDSSKPVPLLESPTSRSSRGQQIEKEIANVNKQLENPKINGTMKTILTDKLNLLQNKLERAVAQSDSESE